MRSLRLGSTVCTLAVAATMVAANVARAERVVVPLEIINGSPILTATIDGKEVPLAFDLGGDFHLTLSESVLRGLQTTPLQETYSFSDAKGNILQSPMFRVARMDIGKASFADVIGHVDTSHPTYRAQTAGREGMIGAPFLQEYRVVLDYAQREMTLIPKESTTAEQDGCSGTNVPFLPQWQGAPVTKATTDAGDLTMVWDTGAPLSLIRKALVDERGLNAKRSFVKSAKFELSGTDFGPLELRVFDYVEPAGTDGFIGYSFFEKNVVCIDFTAQRFRVRKAAGA